MPEAFLLGNGASHYDHVCILTTSDPKTTTALDKVKDWFRRHHPGIRVTGLVIVGLADLACSEDHQRFEEALFRAYFALRGEGREIHVYLAGGFKTMSAAAQEAAGLLGWGKSSTSRHPSACGPIRTRTFWTPSTKAPSASSGSDPAAVGRRFWTSPRSPTLRAELLARRIPLP